jgi:hypothetical protein
MQTYTIKNHIKNIPKGMELNRRIYYITSPAGLESKVFRQFKEPSERFAVMRLVSYIRICQKNYEDDQNNFVNIHREKLKNISGDDYRKYIDWLVENKIIEVNEKYSNLQDFTKSYRFTQKTYDKPIVVTKYETKILEQDSESYNSEINDTTFTPDGKYEKELLYCLQHENQLSIPDADNIIESLDDSQKSYASEWFYEINKGKCFPNPQAKSTRFYFNSIMMSSRYRKYMIYNKNKTLINYDIKCAHPAFIKLLANFDINPNNNNNNNIMYRDTYVSSILRGTACKNKLIESFYNEGDFYDNLRKPFVHMTRENAKKEFNRYKNLSDKSKKKDHIFTQRLVDMGHTDMANYIVESNDIWYILEQIETEYMCTICNRAIDEQIVFIRQHDGFLTTIEDAPIFDNILAEPELLIFRTKKENL